MGMTCAIASSQSTYSSSLLSPSTTWSSPMVAYGCEWPRCGFNAMQPMPLCGCVNAHMLAFVYNASCALAFK